MQEPAACGGKAAQQASVQSWPAVKLLNGAMTESNATKSASVTTTRAP
jgi:hypothetical protein